MDRYRQRGGDSMSPPPIGGVGNAHRREVRVSGGSGSTGDYPILQWEDT